MALLLTKINSSRVRNCVGQSFANQSLFITIATMLWALDFSPAVDEDGEPIMPPLEEWVDEGIVV